MFVGHYGVSFAAKAVDRRVPLFVLVIAVQFVDVFWAVIVLLGIERVRIVPGITATNPSTSITCLTRTASWRPCCGRRLRQSRIVS